MFKALADPTRRALLDALFAEDGQTLTSLEQRLPMSRFGVMKHLKVLEEAGLVVTRGAGREKLHFLNPVPDPARPRPLGQQVRRALGRRAQRAQATTGGPIMSDDTVVSFARGTAPVSRTAVFEIYIKTTPERLWEAITDPGAAGAVQLRRRHHLGLDAGLELPRRGARASSTSPRARTSRSSRRGGSCRPSPRCGATRCKAEGTIAGHLGDRAGRRLVPADRGATTSCPRAPTPSSTAAGR